MENTLVGLTGMSGSGKTTVSDFLQNKGLAIVDCDKISHMVVEKGRPCLYEIVKLFSEDILTSDGNLDRKKLGNIIFADKTSKKELEEIIFPYILFEVFRQIDFHKNNGNNLIVLDAPTLFESKLDVLCDIIISVVADFDICADRISKRDRISIENAKLRLLSQHDREFFIEKSTYYIDNSGSFEQLIIKINGVLDKLLRRING